MSLHYLVKSKYRETSGNLKEMSRLTINLKVLTNLCYSEYNSEYSKCPSRRCDSLRLLATIIQIQIPVARCLCRWSIASSTVSFFHFSPHVNQIQRLHQIIHYRYLHFCLVDPLLHSAPDFVISRIDVVAVRRPKIWRLIGDDHDLLDYCTFGAEAVNDAQTVWVNAACEKDHSQN